MAPSMGRARGAARSFPLLLVVLAPRCSPFVPPGRRQGRCLADGRVALADQAQCKHSPRRQSPGRAAAASLDFTAQSERGAPDRQPLAGRWPLLSAAAALAALAGRRAAAPRRRAAAAEGGEAGGQDLLAKEPRPPWWRRALGSIKRNGVGYFFAYGLVSNVNGCALLAISWALFVKTRNICPTTISPDSSLVLDVLLSLFRPSRLNPQFILYYGAVYLSVGSIMRPLRITVAAALVPFVKRFFDFVQDRLHCPRPVTWVVAFFSLTALSAVAFPTLVFLACAILRVPVAPA